MHLLISGIPATGKSMFSKWLVENHSYVRCPSGEEPGSDFFGEVDRARGTHPNVVIDWGFPVGLLPYVRELVSTGVQPWWFDGDREAALATFLSRHGHPATKADWDRQLQAIDDRWTQIEPVFHGHILDVVTAGPVHLANEERFARMGLTR